MQPWMILALLMGAGIAVLIVAPRLHRQSTNRATSEAQLRRDQRARSLREEVDVDEFPMSSDEAQRVQRGLILRGVRSEILRTDGADVVLIVAAGHALDVAELRSRSHPE